MPSLELCAFLFRKGITLIRIIGKKEKKRFHRSVLCGRKAGGKTDLSKELPGK